MAAYLIIDKFCNVVLKRPWARACVTSAQLRDERQTSFSVFWFCIAFVVSAGVKADERSWSSQLHKAGVGGADDEGAWVGDIPARGWQMCDLFHHSVTRATADSQLEAYWDPALMHPVCMGRKKKRWIQRKTMVEIWEKADGQNYKNTFQKYKQREKDI